jgi:lon-related putative ATP-dependent protease
LKPLEELIGQERALKALQFGLKIKRKGFNIYVAGERGTGKRTAIASYIEEIAKTMSPPSDWCYVNNFHDQNTPNALRLPAGMGVQFVKDMDQFVSNLKKALSTAFESEEYGKRRDETINTAEEFSRKIAEQIKNIAGNSGFSVQIAPIGLLLTPLVRGRPISNEEYAKLPQSVREDIQKKQKALQDQFRGLLKQYHGIERKVAENIENLNKAVASYALEPLFSNLREKYGEIEEVNKYLKDVEEDIINNLSDILSDEKQTQVPFPMLSPREDPTDRYNVNLVVDNSELSGAPVVTEFNPTYSRLFGGIEKEARFGALITDYTMIRAGAAHRANGGFLILPIEGLLTNPLVWDSLKRTISNEKLEIEEPTDVLGIIVTKSLRPEPIPFDTKVLIVGDPELYHLLYVLDKDFKELFKVKSDFDTTMERNKENVEQYALFICSLCHKEYLKHLDSLAIASVIEYSSRLAEDQMKLSTQFSEVADIIREACYYADEERAEFTSKKHVEKALDEKIYRSNLIQKKIEELIARGTIQIDTEGEKVGQVNGLSVLGLGDYSFGRPSKVTASIGVGKEGIIDIEREAALGGPIHSKGIMILSGYLNWMYAQKAPLSLTARLVFEQSYSGVEGDSASSTELYALLSALSSKLVKQYIAVTGSVNQKGEVQAIGGVNEKVEGYYEVCKVKGLNGKQGVVIPASNVQNLMLKEDVVEAIKEGKFHIYPVSTIDEGIEVLTGVKAGKRQPDGTFEKGTINFLVQEKLNQMADRIKEYYPFQT